MDVYESDVYIEVLKFELHVHTEYSHDSVLSLKTLYQKCLEKGIDCIAITDHNTIQGGIAFKEYCHQRGDKISVIVGSEIMTTQGEIIGLYMSQEVPMLLTPEETITRLEEQGAVVYVPHPYDEKRHRTVLHEQVIADNIDRIFCMEGYNGRNIDISYEERQKEVVTKYNKVMVIGSDAHTACEIGRNYMLVKEIPKTANEFRNICTEIEVVKSPCLKRAHQYTRLVRVWKMIRKGDLGGVYRLILRKFRKTV